MSVDRVSHIRNFVSWGKALPIFYYGLGGGGDFDLCLLRILSIDFSYGDGGVLMFNAPLVAGSSADST